MSGRTSFSQNSISSRTFPNSVSGSEYSSCSRQHSKYDAEKRRSGQKSGSRLIKAICFTTSQNQKEMTQKRLFRLPTVLLVSKTRLTSAYVRNLPKTLYSKLPPALLHYIELELWRTPKLYCITLSSILYYTAYRPRTHIHGTTVLRDVFINLSKDSMLSWSRSEDEKERCIQIRNREVGLDATHGNALFVESETGRHVRLPVGR
ncbi:unnamed protein product [Clavelina lepadiformis]|uniref:Uncharacterized protein n=1 Tax=Clavelina lepadiformis TaxID=159417 RepID=A0ABP0F0Z1_CLALP